MRPLIAYFSETALRNNIAVLKSKSPESRHCAVVKANAYGHRVENLLPILSQSVDCLAVAMREEADAIRALGCQLPILLLEGLFSQAEYASAAQAGYWITIGNLHQLEMLKATTFSMPIEVFVKVDTGMHRLGFKPELVESVLAELTALPNIQKITLMTHFATSDERDSPLFLQQIANMKPLETLGYPLSLANSAAILTASHTHYDLVRMGIALYGVSPIDHTVGADFGLQPLLRLESKIIHSMEIRVGESVGYGAKFIAPETMPIGVIACGYADGYPREISEDAYVLVGAFKAPIIGRPAMDMMMIDLRNIPREYWSSSVEIFGDNLPIEVVANWAGTIPYTILTHIASRVYFVKAV
ncbi:alanine racemase [Ignatzschineria ureiclastica]|uniref:Alanine racemase n=1 Tax=Ignatzschineria ureiclastica TaxID=472582 RepID=A0A2U2AF38_9GAMM|nr:alanine racemase [Ignatzschineria ureiclastica]PWD81271.1 alanine racemase [Ignatzschineria ureiclastica]GGZ97665.1 alanine racemase, biosynthetic [Ignatzschineria ureiclastica]